MSSAVKTVLWLCAAASITASLAACSPSSNSGAPILDLGDVEDYANFLETRGEGEQPEPFKPEPLFVSAVGKVQAQPDIAVITAKITAEDKNESRAVNEMGKIINQVQTALKGRNIETGFTAINSNREFDEACRNDNQFAQSRHSEINSDFYFNQRLDRRGDTKTKRREPKLRVKQATCFAQTIKVSTNMVIRIQPADAAGDVLRALSDAGAQNSRLYGYDFTDYDALYQDAAVKAVKLAREKAETVARLAGGKLGEIESFSVDAPERQSRFGPQPNVIRPANRYPTPNGSAIDRQINSNNYISRPQPFKVPAPVAVEYDEVVVTSARLNQDSPSEGETIVVQPAYVEYVRSPLVYETVYENGVARRVVKTPAATQERFVPAITQTLDQANANTNALSISLLSGPKTISVSASLGYTYDTPLNGKIIVEPEDK